MIKHAVIFALLVAALVIPVGAVAATGMAWETVKTEIRDAKSVVKDTDIEIMTAPSAIIIHANRHVNVKVFTILGRLVSSENVAPGTSRLPIGAHGVYIIKVGDLTCKVAV